MEITHCTAPEQDGLQLLSKYRGAVMGFAALWIFVFHEWQLTLGGVGTLGWIEVFLKRIGFAGVDIFLLLSGMGLTYAIGKGSLISFYYRRLRRLYLPFLAVGLCYLLLGKWNSTTFWGNITGFNFYDKNMYSFLWFVPAILTLYIAFPLYYKFFTAHRQPLYCLLGALALWLLLSIQLRNTLRYDLYGFTNRIPVFLVGIYLGWRSRQKRPAFTPATWGMLLIVLILGIYLAYETNYKGYYLLVPISNCCLPNLLIAVSFPLLMAKLLDILHKKPVRWIGIGLCKVLGFFGMFSLELYCIQEALGYELIPWLYGKGCTPLVVNLGMLIATTAFAYIQYLLFDGFWKLVELPWKRKKRKTAAV